MNRFYKNKKKYILLFSFFILIIVSVLIYFYVIKKKEQKLYSFSEKLENKYETLSLYSDNNTVEDYSTLNSPGIIGKIEIPKISLSYSILSSCSEDLLKISPCRLYGPDPNQVGNLCIASHNYDNNKFFSNINKLSLGDSIYIYDLNNNFLIYTIYDKFEVLINDTSILNQETQNKKEITLITCNNQNKRRFILKAKEMD